MRRKILLPLMIVCSVLKGQIGIGTSNPEKNAVLDFVANNKGVLFPRINSKNINEMNLGTSENSMLVMNTDEKKIYFWNGNIWKLFRKVVPPSDAVFTIDCSTVETNFNLQTNSPAVGYFKVNLIVTEPGNISLQTDYQKSVRFIGADNINTGTIPFKMNATGTPTSSGNVIFSLSGGGNTCKIPATIN